MFFMCAAYLHTLIHGEETIFSLRILIAPAIVLVDTIERDHGVFDYCRFIQFGCFVLKWQIL